MITANVFGELERMSAILDNEDLLEARFENDANGNVLYIGYSPFPNADPATPNFYILKVEYEADAIVRKRLPKDGLGFKYIWNNRADYFV